MLGNASEGLLAAGASGHEVAFSEANTIQQQKAAKLNDIFKSITSIAAAFVPGGEFGSLLKKAPKAAASAAGGDSGGLDF